jgi:hypothetical protein
MKKSYLKIILLAFAIAVFIPLAVSAHQPRLVTQNPTVITDLEHSLRVMDIEKIDFTAQDKDLTDYSFSIRTYWLH